MNECTDCMCRKCMKLKMNEKCDLLINDKCTKEQCSDCREEIETFNNIYTADHLFNIRKIDVDSEKIQQCVSCREVSTSLEIESMYEITLFYPTEKIYICDCCKDKLKETLNNFQK